MADLPEVNEWTQGIYQLETSDPVLGGPEGIDNLQGKQLANRTKWLKDQIAKIIDGTVAIGKAVQLKTARTLRFNGAATGSGSYDGSADTEITLALADLSWTKITGDKPTTLSGYGITDTYDRSEIDSMIAEASALPVGATVAFPLDKVAPGFLELDGSVKSIAVYPDLAAFLGTAFNKGDEGTGNFRLPESRGEFLRGWDHGRGVDPDRVVGSSQSDALRDHYHAVLSSEVGSVAAPVSGNVVGSATNNLNATYRAAGTSVLPATTTSLVQGPVAARFGPETRPRNLAVLWCIKAWNAPISQGNIDIAALAALATQATEVKLGTAKIATQAQTNAGADDATIVTPKKMRWGFGISLAANGYITFPTWLGGLIVQWGQINIGDISNGGSTSYSLPLAFPANHFQTLLSCAESGGGAWNAFLVSKSLTGFVWSPMEWSSVVQNAKVTYLSIGS